jgi:thymidine kinase
MCSGKSQEIIRIINLFKYADKKIIIIKNKKDTRDKDEIISRNGQKVKGDVFLVDYSEEIINLVKSVAEENNTIVFIDEAQFFDNFLTEVVKRLSWGMNIKVIISGLDKDFRGNTFGPMGDLLAIADKVLKLNAICAECKKYYANFTFRKTKSTNQIEVGDSNEYEAKCNYCWTES